MELSVVVYPSDDHVSPDSVVVLGETEAHVAEGLHLNLERHVPLARRPEDQEIVVQNGAVLPLEGEDVDGNEEEDAARD